jgi:hypothetical protein
LEFAAADEGRLTTERARALAKHITQCDRCRVLYALMIHNTNDATEGDDD